MITILHGDDLKSSRNYFLELKTRSEEHIQFDGKQISITDITQEVEGGSLFGNTKHIYIDNLISRVESNEKKAIIAYILENAHLTDFTLWEGKELKKSNLFIFKSATIRPFKIPAIIFVLQDSLRPNSGTKLVQLFHEVLKNSPSEMVLPMLISRIRLLLALSVKSSENITEIKTIAPWLENKLTKQAVFFKQDELINIHHNLAIIDTDMKTGKLKTPLNQAIDNLLLAI